MSYFDHTDIFIYHLIKYIPKNKKSKFEYNLNVFNYTGLHNKNQKQKSKNDGRILLFFDGRILL